MLNYKSTGKKRLGVTFVEGQKAIVRVWERQAKQMTLFVEGQSSPIELAKESGGYWWTETSAIKPDTTYSLLVNNQRDYHDPASLSLPFGGEGPSQAIDTTTFYWEDSYWVNPPADAYHLFNLDVATFTLEGTFGAAARYISKLKKSGKTAVFVNPFEPINTANEKQDTPFFMAVNARYGGPKHFQHFVNTCHYEGLAVVIDFPSCSKILETGMLPVSSHIGHRIRMALTSEARRRDQARKEAFRQYYIDAALTWFRDFHVDALRIDGFTRSPQIRQLVSAVRQAAGELSDITGRQYYLLVEAEDASTDNRQQPNLIQAGTFHQDYLYDPRFAGILSSLFRRTI